MVGEQGGLVCTGTVKEGETACEETEEVPSGEILGGRSWNSKCGFFRKCDDADHLHAQVEDSLRS